MLLGYKERVGKIGEEYSDLSIDLSFLTGEFIELAINSVAKNAIIGGFRCFNTFHFSKNMRTTLIIATAIPISIIATFVLIFAKISINIVSLGGSCPGVGDAC